MWGFIAGLLAGAGGMCVFAESDVPKAPAAPPGLRFSGRPGGPGWYRLGYELDWGGPGVHNLKEWDGPFATKADALEARRFPDSSD